MVIPHLAVVGKSETGKTSLVVELIEVLRSKGYKVATIKHTKGDFSIDSEGTDTSKHAEAGAELVVFSTPSETSFVVKGALELDDIFSTIRDIGGYDLVIIEGMKEEDIPKISVDEDIDGDLYHHGDVERVINWIEEEIKLFNTIDKLPGSDCGRCGFETCEKLAEEILQDRAEIQDCRRSPGGKIDLIVNGEKVELTNFPAKIIKNTLKGLVSSLKDVDDIDSIEISFDEL